MQIFLVVDDDPKQRKIIEGHISYELERENAPFLVKAIHPLKEIPDYFKFIEDENVCVLILDEKLKNKPDAAGKFVTYFGHDLVTEIRERHKDLPIFTVTNYPEVTEINELFGEYEQIIYRTNFYNNTEKYIPVMLRAAAKFVDRYSNELSEFTALSQAIAGGDTSLVTRERLQALQSSVELPVLGYDDRQSWLKEYEKQIEELEKIKEELTKRLEK